MRRPLVLDACCGSRMFWFDRSDARAIFLDNRIGEYQVDRGTPGTRGRSPVVVRPTVQADFSALPFRSQTFSHVVFDPPHILRDRASTGIIRQKYGCLFAGWREQLSEGFAECFRVLRPGGTLIFKWGAIDIPLKDVLALTAMRPLYGHQSGKKATTHWVAFVKEFDEQEATE